MTENKKCETYRCGYNAKDGSDYCGRHSPEAVARRKAKSKALNGFDSVIELRAERDHLLWMLKRLTNEAGGCCRAFEHELRESVGNTNYTCLAERVREANHVIENAEAHS